MTPDHAARAVDDRDLWLLAMDEQGRGPGEIVSIQRCGTCRFWQAGYCVQNCKCPDPAKCFGRHVKPAGNGGQCSFWDPIAEAEVSALLAALAAETEAA
jgi:hypothetical protein